MLQGLLTTAIATFGIGPMIGCADRVMQAKQNVDPILDKLAKQSGLRRPFVEVHLRAYKAERTLELWANDKRGAKLKLLRTYPIAAMSGALGPKRQEGDKQVPEGGYVINRFNPLSSYHLSLGLNYPNASDLVRTTNPDKPGGDIFIHGDRVSIGCLAMTNPLIEEIYTAAFEAKTSGQREIRVDILPCRLDDFANLPAGPFRDFWQEIKPFESDFLRTKRPAKISIDKLGKYRFKSSK